VKIRTLPLALSIALVPIASSAEDNSLPPVIVVGPRLSAPAPAVSSKGEAEIAAQRSATSDTARLLQDVPGLSLYGAGGVSSLPAIHGLADDRLNIKVDGVEIAASCPNHMNSPLSYIDPSNVGSIRVFAGIAPVSAGGDSIGGAIVVEPTSPTFAEVRQGSIFKGEAGAFYRSNGNARGANLAAAYANESLNLTYTAATAKSDNYKAGGDFKTFAATGNPGHNLA
jgi:iron complex outermembrane receptor protein